MKAAGITTPVLCSHSIGDGTRIPLIVVSPHVKPGHISHDYADHVSIPKFIERNWNLPTISERSRDNLPNPKSDWDNPCVPKNTPAISDLFGLFDFEGHRDRSTHLDKKILTLSEPLASKQTRQGLACFN